MKLSPQQAQFLQSNTRGRIFLGSIGSGKTFIMCLAALHEALNNRDTLITSFSYRNLKDVVLKTLIEIAESNGIKYQVNVSDMTFAVNNHPILLRTADNPDRLRSYNLHSVFIEEARELNREVFDVLLGRLRKSEDCFWSIVSTTRGRNWFHDMIKEEGLLSIFEPDLRYIASKNLTVVRSTIDDSPFLPQTYIDDLKRQYTSAFARQELYAEIVDANAEVINPNWFIIRSFSRPTVGIRFWDVAVTTKTSSDYSAGCLMTRINNQYHIHDIIRVKLPYPDLKQLIVKTALEDGTGVHVGIEDAGQTRAIIDDIRRVPELGNHVLRTFRPTKDKITRAYPFASQAQLGNVILNEGLYIRNLKDECVSFNSESVANNSAHDDMIDSCTAAYSLLSTGNTGISQLG